VLVFIVDSFLEKVVDFLEICKGIYVTDFVLFGIFVYFVVI